MRGPVRAVLTDDLSEDIIVLASVGLRLVCLDSSKTADEDGLCLSGCLVVYSVASLPVTTRPCRAVLRTEFCCLGVTWSYVGV
jgi:hypothetical protein